MKYASGQSAKYLDSLLQFKPAHSFCLCSVHVLWYSVGLYHRRRISKFPQPPKARVAVSARANQPFTVFVDNTSSFACWKLIRNKLPYTIRRSNLYNAVSRQISFEHHNHTLNGITHRHLLISKLIVFRITDMVHFVNIIYYSIFFKNFYMQTKQKIFNFIILTSYTLYNLHV